MNIPQFACLLGFLAFGLSDGHSAQILPPVSTAAQATASASGNSFNPTFSADGRHLVFVSQANNLVTNDDLSRFLDVFVRDLESSNTVLVSVAAAGMGGGNSDCNYPSISSNGLYVAFASAASNLIANATNSASDVFLRDLSAGVTRLISVDLAGNPPANPFPYQQTNVPVSGNPLLSANGQLVFFESAATNLVSLFDTNLFTDIFVRDVVTATTRLVSINAAGTGTGNGPSGLCSITPDGRWVAFTSKATDLVSSNSNRRQEVFVRDMLLQRTYWASSNALNPTDLFISFLAPVLSPNGRFVYFKKSSSVSSNTIPEELWRFDVQDQSCLCIHTNTVPNDLPSLSADGNTVAFAAPDGIYFWQETLQTNTWIACGVAPSLSLDATTLLFKRTSEFCGETNLPGVYVMELPSKATHLVSQKADGSPASFVEVSAPALSPDGRLAAFESADASIVASDLNQGSDVFVRDWAANTTALASPAHLQRPARTGASLCTIFPNCVSTNGKVVFTSLDNNLVARDTNGWPDVFVKNLQTGDITPISVLPENNNSFPANRVARTPVISANGRSVAWTWQDVPSRAQDVYVRDMETQTNPTLVSQDLAGQPSKASLNPRFSRDGRMIVFESKGSNLVGYVSVNTAVTNIYVHIDGTNQLVSINPEGTADGSGDSFDPQFTPDGQWIIFQSKAANLTANATRGLFARNLHVQQTQLISAPGYFDRDFFYSCSSDSRYIYYQRSDPYTSIRRHNLLEPSDDIILCEDGSRPAVSTDGRWLVYRGTSGSAPNVFLKDLFTQETNIISIDRFGSGPANRSCYTPLLTQDGRFVVFTSIADNLVDTTTNASYRIYARDRLLGKTSLLGATESPLNNTANSSQPVLCADGRTVIFQSFAPALVEGDYNNTQDIFVAHLGAVDSDGDGMDDDWEITYFGNLSQPGSSDYDGDGRTNLQEFLAGTDPTNQNSILRVLTVTSITSGSVTVLWNATPGRTYRVQFKTNLTDSAWTDLPGSVLANSTTGAKLDTTIAGNSKRFYRVVCQPY